jgi:hypothetical protein
MTKPLPVEPVREISWGIIRYAAGSGLFPEENAAGFDGWYICREDALALARDWSCRYPEWIVALVSSDTIWFGKGDFAVAKNAPLTTRENALLMRRMKAAG